MHVFLAGSTGVIGRRVLPLLLERGHAVTAMTRHPAGREQLISLGAEAVVANAFDRVALRVALQDAKPDVVMHQLTDLSGGSSQANAALRTRGTRNLVAAARVAGVERVVAQSVSWGYEPGDEPATESVPLDFQAGESRRTTIRGVAALEDAVRQLPSWVVLRYGSLYGPGTWYAPDGARAQDAREGRLLADEDVTSFVHVDDAAAAAVAALDWPDGAVNVCDDEPAAGWMWLPRFCEAVGAPPPRRAQRGERSPWARGADNGRARDDLGWIPSHRTWRTGFAALEDTATLQV